MLACRLQGAEQQHLQDMMCMVRRMGAAAGLGARERDAVFILIGCERDREGVRKTLERWRRDGTSESCLHVSMTVPFHCHMSEVLRGNCEPENEGF